MCVTSHQFVIILIHSAAKIYGATFIRMEKEEYFKEMGLPLGTRLLLKNLVKQVCSHSNHQVYSDLNRYLTFSGFRI